MKAIVDGTSERIGSNKIVISPAGSWHEFKNRTDQPVFLINIHPVPEMSTEWT